MKSVVRRSGLLVIALAMLLSSGINAIAASKVFAVDAKSLSYKKTADLQDCSVVQGGATDGTYAYFACEVEGSAIEIVKLGLDGKEVKRNSLSEKQLGHANDMTYNSKLKSLVVSAWTTGGTGDGKLVFISPETLDITSTEKVSTGTWNNLCYNAAKDQYVSNGKLFDSSFKVVGEVYSNSEVDKIANGSNQGIACDESYVYVMRGGLGGGVNDVSGKFKVIVYDWSGKNTAIYDLFVDKYAENENLFVANGKLYIGINGISGGKLDEQFGTIEGAVTGQGEVGSNIDSSDNCGDWGGQKEVMDLGIPYYDVASCTCSDKSGGASGMSGDNTFKKMTTYMSSKGLSSFAIAGILGNWRLESKYDPFINQNGKNGWDSNAYGLAQWDGSRRTTLVEKLRESGSATEGYFSTYYAKEYSDWPASFDEDEAGSGLPAGVTIPDEVVNAWIKVQVDLMLEEMKDPFYSVKYSTAKERLKTELSYLEDSDNIVDALNKATSAGHAATIFSLIFERQKNPDTAFGERATSANEIIEKVKALTGGGSTTTGSSGCSGGSTAPSGSVQNLQKLAKEYTQSWETSKTLSQTESYSAAVKRSKYVGCPSSPGDDCGAFVYILIHESGWDPKYGGGSGQTAHMDAWFSDSGNGWAPVSGLVGVDAKKIDSTKLQPGDVLLTVGHIYIFVGDILGDGSLYYASASMCKRSPAYHTFGDYGSYTVYRKTGGQ